MGRKRGTTSSIGGIVGHSFSAEIVGCSNAAEVISKNQNYPHFYVGGIVGGVTGIGGENNIIIRECVNYGNVYVHGTGDYASAGGIVAEAEDGGDVVSCCNYGMISYGNFEGSTNIGISGIVAVDYWAHAINCYNAGSICVGKGEGSGIGSGFNSYSVGTISGENAQSAIPDCFIGNSSSNKVYWLSGTTYAQEQIAAQYEKSQEYMKSKAFVDELNKNSVEAGYGEVWKMDTVGVNNGYPILKNVPYEGISLPDDGDGESYIDPTPAPETGETVEHLYKDDKYTTPVKTDSIKIYANGGTVTKNDVKTNYKSYSLYTNILASYKYWTDTKGKYQTATGKVVVGITGSQTKPTLNKKGKIVDADAAKIASASIKNGRITVTAKSLPGTVYLWVLDTGDTGAYTCCPVTVKSAPSAIYTYATSDITYGTTKKYTSKTLSVGDSTDVYIYPIYKDGKTVKKATDGTYTASVAKNVQDYFTVTKVDSEHFVIRATGLKNGKKVSGKVTIQCDQNGKKAVFTVTAKK